MAETLSTRARRLVLGAAIVFVVGAVATTIWAGLRPTPPPLSGSLDDLEYTEPSQLCVGPRRADCLSMDLALAQLDAPLQIDAAVPPPGGTQGTAVLGASSGDVRFAIKWRPAESESLLSDPAKELAVFALQQLFVPEQDAVVPPTRALCLDRAALEELTHQTLEPFEGSDCVLGYAAWWLHGAIGHRAAVSRELAEPRGDFTLYDRERFEREPAYRRNVAIVNLVTYLSRNVDAHLGQFVMYPDDGHWFVIDQSMTFDVLPNPRVAIRDNLSEMTVPSIPADIAARLVALTREELNSLAVLVEWEERDGRLVRVPQGDLFQADERVRREGSRIQIGLEPDEIEGVWERVEILRARLDDETLQTFE